MVNTPEISFENVISDLQKLLNITGELKYTMTEGLLTEKNKSTPSTKIIIDVLTLILDQDDPKIDNPNELLIHRNNKKIIKDTIVTMINNMKYISSDDKKVKVMFLGKLLQTLYNDKQ
jgi:hypothetical protein